MLPARLHGVKEDGGAKVELLLLRERGADTWECLVRPGRRLQPGATVNLGDGEASATIVGVLDESGTRLVQFRAGRGASSTSSTASGRCRCRPTSRGRSPIPSRTRPSTAPTSARPPRRRPGCTSPPALLDRLVGRGAHIARVELDVGLDTFRPVSEDDPELHHIHTEHYRVSEQVASAVAECRERGGRVIAVGTTSVRALESAWSEEAGAVCGHGGQHEPVHPAGLRSSARSTR